MIEMRLCKCGCGKSKLGNAQLKFFSNACRQRNHRKNELDKKLTTKGECDA